MRPGSPPASVFRSPRLIFELSNSQSSSTYRMGETLRQLYKLLFAFFGLAKQGTWLVTIGTLSIAGKGTRNGQGGACATTQDSRDEILLFVIEDGLSGYNKVFLQTEKKQASQKLGSFVLELHNLRVNCPSQP